MGIMLYCVVDSSDPLLSVLYDDPVRPEIPHSSRVDWPRSAVFVSVDDSGEPTAVVCVRFMSSVTATVSELFVDLEGELDTVVFYTIWSYRRGSGAALIFAVRDWIVGNRAKVTRFVTLSPPSEVVRRFHLSNGAREWRHNGSTVNYLYS